MSRHLLTVLALLGLFGFAPAANQPADKSEAGQICVLEVTGMTCGACAAQVEKAAKKIDGVKAAKASQPKGVAEITYDPAKTTPETLAKIITRKTGFQTEPSKPDAK